MPRFAANLGFLFTEHPFLDRFAAAARAAAATVPQSRACVWPVALLMATPLRSH